MREEERLFDCPSNKRRYISVIPYVSSSLSVNWKLRVSSCLNINQAQYAQQINIPTIDIQFDKMHLT